MKKNKQNKSSTTQPINNVDNGYSIDQNYRKNHNSSIVDLVTHKQKQIQKKKYRLGGKQKNFDDSQDQLLSSYQNNYQFQDENANNGVRNRYREKQVDKQKLLEVINRLVAKNKINSKIAFEVPILSIQDFSMYDEGIRGDVSWNKMSSILENDYKIYGVRVDSIAQYVRKMSESLGRRDAQDNQAKQKQAKQLKDAKTAKQQKQKEKAIKLSQLMSTRQNLGAYLQKNSQNLDINLRTKLMMRKDPLFERTSRKFDHSSYGSFFMNTLSFGKGLFMQINASQDDNTQTLKGDTMVDKQRKQQIQGNIDKDRRQELAEKQLAHSNQIDPIVKYNSILGGQAVKKLKTELKIRKTVQKFTTSLQQFGITQFSEELKQQQNRYDYYKIINKIQSGHLKTGFEYGKKILYEQSQSQQQVQQVKQITSPKHPIEIYDEQKQEQKNKLILDQQIKQSEQICNQQIPQSNIQGQTENELQQVKDVKIGQSDKRNEEDNEQLQKNGQVNNQQEQKQINEQRYQVYGNEQNNSKFGFFLPNQQQQQKSMTHIGKPQNKKNRKIKQVITFKQKEQKMKDKTTTRKGGLSKQIKNIIKRQKKSICEQVVKKQKQMFDPKIKENFKKVIKKQKILNISPASIFDSYTEKNLFQPYINCGYQIKHTVQYRPLPTKQQLKRQRQKAKLALHLQKNSELQGPTPSLSLNTNVNPSESINNNANKNENITIQTNPNTTQQLTEQKVNETTIPININNTQPLLNSGVVNLQEKNEQISSQSQKQSSQLQIQQISVHRRNQTITNVKQNIYNIIKSLKNTDFKNLVKEYTKKHNNISAATIFIAMLHLSNERFIRTVQLGNKNFKIYVSDF